MSGLNIDFLKQPCEVIFYGKESLSFYEIFLQGVCYFEGIYVNKNVAKAKENFEYIVSQSKYRKSELDNSDKVLNNGKTVALKIYETSLLFLAGMDMVAGRYKEAAERYKILEEINRFADYNLALCYELGLGVSKNPHRAFTKFNKIKDNFGSAMYRYANFFYYGLNYSDGFRYNEELAVESYKKAMDLGNGLAARMLGAIYETKGEFKKAVECYRKADILEPDNVGLWENFHEYDICYEEYFGLTDGQVFFALEKDDSDFFLRLLACWRYVSTKKYDMAEPYLRWLADRNFSEAQFMLAKLIERGVFCDYISQAEYFYRNSAMSGHGMAYEKYVSLMCKDAKNTRLLEDFFHVFYSNKSNYKAWSVSEYQDRLYNKVCWQLFDAPPTDENKKAAYEGVRILLNINKLEAGTLRKTFLDMQFHAYVISELTNKESYEQLSEWYSDINMIITKLNSYLMLNSKSDSSFNDYEKKMLCNFKESALAYFIEKFSENIFINIQDSNLILRILQLGILNDQTALDLSRTLYCLLENGIEPESPTNQMAKKYFCMISSIPDDELLFLWDAFGYYYGYNELKYNLLKPIFNNKIYNFYLQFKDKNERLQVEELSELINNSSYIKQKKYVEYYMTVCKESFEKKLEYLLSTESLAGSNTNTDMYHDLYKEWLTGKYNEPISDTSFLILAEKITEDDERFVIYKDLAQRSNVDALIKLADYVDRIGSKNALRCQIRAEVLKNKNR